MKLADRLRQLMAWTLAFQLIATPNGARAAATDGSTLAMSRGAVPNGAPGAVGLSTDSFSGAATQRLPIELPPGTGGLTPELTLGYTSASRSDSWVGYGWSLGLSSISRSLTHGVPKYNATDIFELDGQPLVLDATQNTAHPPYPTDRYHTRRESFLRIIHNAAADTWTVTRKNGTKLRYGLSSNARVQKAAGQTYQWLLSEEEDLQGNVITTSYDRTTDTGTAYPLEIRYTLRRQAGGSLASIGGSAANDRVVGFTLETRPDTPVNYAAGFLRQLGHRLKWIDVKAAGQEIRRYELRYTPSPDSLRSRLSAVALYGTDALVAPTAPLVTEFSYQSNVEAGTTGWNDAATWPWPAALALVNDTNRDNGVRLVDVDGDGRPDLLKGYNVQTSPDYRSDGLQRTDDSGAYLNNGTGFSLLNKSLIFVLPTLTSSTGPLPVAFATLTDGVLHPTGIEAMDLTGDGRADLFGQVTILDADTGARDRWFLEKWIPGSSTGFVEQVDPLRLSLTTQSSASRGSVLQA